MLAHCQFLHKWRRAAVYSTRSEVVGAFDGSVLYRREVERSAGYVVPAGELSLDRDAG
jgi:hypothetical protein